MAWMFLSSKSAGLVSFEKLPDRYLKKGFEMSQERIESSKKSAAIPAASKAADAKPATRKRAAKSSTAGMPGTARNTWSDEERHNMIATAAYYRAERRGFTGGCAIDDWLIAESEVDAMLYH